MRPASAPPSGRAAFPRDQLFVTTKVRNGEHGYESTLKAYDDSLGRLDVSCANPGHMPD
jgi:diketogulonate reductase-like aldo/keto reductase